MKLVDLFETSVPDRTALADLDVALADVRDEIMTHTWRDTLTPSRKLNRIIDVLNKTEFASEHNVTFTTAAREKSSLSHQTRLNKSRNQMAPNAMIEPDFTRGHPITVGISHLAAMLVRDPQQFSTFAQQLRRIIGHELIHRDQFFKQSSPGNHKYASPSQGMFKYMSDPSERQAHAYEIVHELTDAGLDPQAIRSALTTTKGIAMLMKHSPTFARWKTAVSDYINYDDGDLTAIRPESNKYLKTIIKQLEALVDHK